MNNALRARLRIYQARKKAAFHGAQHQCNERKAGVSDK